MTEPSFQTLGRYTIRAEIGRGGFATVYQALDASLNREVALKVLHPQMSADRSFVERFRKEARTLASLRHPHIVTVYEVSEVEGRLFIAMELAHGSSLAQAIADRKRFPWVDTLAVLKPVSEALDYAHDQGVVHRDLKPANVLLDAERGPLLTDFGFARLLGDSSASMSLSGGILGTPAYIAPEVWELDTAAPAADIYALGCIAYEMLTGDVLFVGKTPMQSMRAHDRGPQFPANWPADVPPGVATALQVALARKPESRYPKATTFWHALNDLEANAQAAREQAERQAVADQWKAEAGAAMAAAEWSAAKMAVGRWLSITPDDPQAQAARQEIERQMQLEGERQQKEEAERAAQAALTLAAARKAEEERKTKEEADRKAREEQERQRQAELAAQAAAAEKAKQEAAERERQKQAREAAKLAEEEARRKELARQQPVIAKSVQSAQTATPATKAKSNRTWLYVVGGVIAVVVIAVVLGIIKPVPPPAPTAAPAPTQASAQPADTPTVQPADTPTVMPVDTPTVIPFQGIAEKSAPDCSYGGLMKSIEAIDDFTVKFTLCAPDVAFPSKIAFASLGIQSARHLEETGGQPLESALGTGPYMVEEWVRGDHLTFVANPNYWGDPPKTRSIVFRWNADSVARLNSVGSEVDGIDNPDPSNFDRIQADSSLKLYPREALNVFYLGMNNTKPPFDNERVRQAIAMGIDRQTIVDKFYPPGSSVADYFTPCAIPGGCEGDPWYPFDPEKAKVLLAEAGFPDGFQTTLSYRDVVRTYLSTPGKVAEEIQAQLKNNLGIDVTIDVQESGTFLDNASQGNLSLFLLGWAADYPDQTDFLDYHFGKGASNQFGQKFDDLTAALAQAGSLSDQAVRNELYAQANSLIKQHVPMVPIAHSGSATVWKAIVADAHSSPLGDERFELMSIPSVPSQDTLVWMQAAEPLSLYCSDETDGESFRACGQIFDSLLSYEPGGASLQPGLAESWTTNADGTEWTFNLRQGAKFSDGTPVTANDVVATYAVQWDASDPLHVGDSGRFDYWSAFFWGFLNPKQ